MSANLESLIRLRHHTVEEKQKFLSSLYTQADQLSYLHNKLSNELAHEREAVDDLGTVEAIAYFGRYSELMRHKIAQIEDEQEKLEARISIAQDDLRLAFAEQKKIEIIQRRRKAEALAAREKKDAAALDEIGTTGFLRRREREGDGKK